MMKSILVLTCLCFVGVSSVYEMSSKTGTSKKVLDFATYFNGDFDNKAQTEEVGDNHDLLEVRIIPVDIKCLQPNVIMFAEVVANKVVQILNLLVITDGIEDTVSVTIYNFTDYTKYRAREFNVESLYNLSCEYIQGDPDCVASYRIAREGFIYGNYPFCRYTVNGKHPRFTALYTCDSLTLTIPMNSGEASPMQPYEIPRTGPKYPLINPPPGYVSPCGN